jgi:hypothetical protein
MSRRFQILVVFVILAFLSSGLINPSTNRASSQKLKPMKGFWQPLSTTTLGPKALIDHHESNNPVYNYWFADIYEGGITVWSGDINQDGWNDIIFGTESSRLRIWLQNPTCHQLIEWLDLPTRVVAFDIAVSDINHDGQLEIAVLGSLTNAAANDVQGYVQIFFRSTDGYQASDTLYKVGEHPKSIEIADVTSDTKPDMLVSSLDVLDELVQQPDGGFTLVRPPSPSIGDYERPNDIVTGDFNGDGRNDVAVQVNQRQDTVIVYDQNSSGILEAGVSLPWPFNDGYVLATNMTGGDVTGDHKMDLIVTANYNTPYANVVVFKQLGGGGFAIDQVIPSFENPASPNLADMDGDGKLDLVMMNLGYGSFTVHYQLPGGGLGPENHYDVGGVSNIRKLHFATVADVTGDGKQDIVYLSDFFGLATAAQGVAPVCPKEVPPAAKIPHFLYAIIDQEHADGMVAGDFNNDGLDDFATILIPQPNTSDDPVIQIIYQLVDGSFAFGKTISFSPALPISLLATGDLNKDGRLDFAFANIYYDHFEVGVSLQDKNGNFLAPDIYAVPEKPLQMYMGDWTGDGLEDLGIIANSGFYLLAGQNNGTLTPPVLYLQDELQGPSASNVVDWNQDGFMDLIAYWRNPNNESENPVRVFLQNPGNGFTMLPTVMFDYPRAMVAGDLNGDNLPDIVMSHPVNAPLAKLGLISQLPNGFMADRRILSAHNYDSPGDIAVSDLNLDGLNDVLVMNSGGFPISVFTQDKQHLIDPPIYYDIYIWGNSFGHTIAGVDTNSDGKPDVFANATPDNYILFLKVIPNNDIFLPIVKH